MGPPTFLAGQMYQESLNTYCKAFTPRDESGETRKNMNRRLQTKSHIDANAIVVAWALIFWWQNMCLCIVSYIKET